jgi:hypothetical protein
MNMLDVYSHMCACMNILTYIFAYIHKHTHKDNHDTAKRVLFATTHTEKHTQTYRNTHTHANTPKRARAHTHTHTHTRDKVGIETVHAGGVSEEEGPKGRRHVCPSLPPYQPPPVSLPPSLPPLSFCLARARALTHIHTLAPSRRRRTRVEPSMRDTALYTCIKYMYTYTLCVHTRCVYTTCVYVVCIAIRDTAVPKLYVLCVCICVIVCGFTYLHYMCAAFTYLQHMCAALHTCPTYLHHIPIRMYTSAHARADAPLQWSLLEACAQGLWCVREAAWCDVHCLCLMPMPPFSPPPSPSLSVSVHKHKMFKKKPRKRRRGSPPHVLRTYIKRTVLRAYSKAHILTFVHTYVKTSSTHSYVHTSSAHTHIHLHTLSTHTHTHTHTPWKQRRGSRPHGLLGSHPAEIMYGSPV